VSVTKKPCIPDVCVYIYVCVCICVCVCALLPELEYEAAFLCVCFFMALLLVRLLHLGLTKSVRRICTCTFPVLNIPYAPVSWLTAALRFWHMGQVGGPPIW